MKPVDQVIASLEHEPEKWTQDDYTLAHENGTEIWTANAPFLNIDIYRPRRKISLIDKFRLQMAVYRWHRKPLQVDS